MVSLSCEVDPAFREYERTVVTAFDAYVKPVVDRYLADLDAGLAAAGVPAPLQIMQSRGGVPGSAIARGAAGAALPLRAGRRRDRRRGWSGAAAGCREPHHHRYRRHQLPTSRSSQSGSR